MNKKLKLSLTPTWNEMVAFVTTIRTIAQTKDDERHDQGWKLAATVEIPRNLCCLHNASIDDDLKGWCADNPHRLKVAKQAITLVDDWSCSRKAARIYKRAWNRYAKHNHACIIN